MSVTGGLYDFNITDNLVGTQVSSDNYGWNASQTARQARITSNREAHAINDLEALYPFFRTTTAESGQRVGWINDERGEIWATYFYRGAVNYNGRAAVLFDLIRDPNRTRSGLPFTVGFALMEANNLSPMLMVIDSGYNYRIERVSCP